MSIDLDAVRLKFIFEQLSKDIVSDETLYIAKLYMYEDVYAWREEVDRIMRRDRA